MEVVIGWIYVAYRSLFQPLNGLCCQAEQAVEMLTRELKSKQRDLDVSEGQLSVITCSEYSHTVLYWS